MKTRAWIWLFSGIFLFCLLCLFLFPRLNSKACIAEIYQNDVLIQTIDLSALPQATEIPLQSEHGENIILAEPGRISMRSASCPDQLCVKQGHIQNGTYPIVCLPNRVVIKITGEGKTQTDAVSR